MWALRKSGVTFRTASNNDGSAERWQPPKLPAWEVPKRNPHERRRRAPDVAARLKAADATGDLADGVYCLSKDLIFCHLAAS
jgi:hypothetical protein